MRICFNNILLSESLLTLSGRFLSGMIIFCIILLYHLLVTPHSFGAARDSKIQSPARPFGLDIVDTVKVSGSDAASRDFNNNYLQTFVDWGDAGMFNETYIQNNNAIALDPSKLFLSTEYDVRIYFVTENTTNHNTLGFTTGGGDIIGDNSKLIFPDATLAGKKATESSPLRSGDFVNTGTISPTLLDFFLIADGAQGGTDVLSTQASSNPDGLNHVVAYALQDSPYLFIGFEDSYGGGDGNFSDVLFAVDVGIANISAMSNVPEPSVFITLSTFLLFGVYIKKRQDAFIIKSN